MNQEENTQAFSTPTRSYTGENIPQKLGSFRKKRSSEDTEPRPEGYNTTSEPRPESYNTTSEPSPESYNTTSEPSPESYNPTSEPSPESYNTTSEPSPESYNTTSEPSPESYNTTSEPSPENYNTTSQPSPESYNTTSEPSPEGHNTSSEPNPELRHNTSSEDSAQPESSPEPEGWPEPGPDWDKAYKQWQGAWPTHTYMFATIYLLMFFYSGYYIVVNIKDGLSQKYLSVSLNMMMCFMTFTRALVLYIDPYHQGTVIQNKLPMQILWSLGTPCLLASDSLCILALAESASVNVIHQRYQRLPYIVVIVALHFILVITTDTVVSSYSEAKVMILYCQIFSIVWGTVLGCGYFKLAHKIDKELFKAAGRKKSRGDWVYMLLIYLSSASNFFGCFLILYSAVGVFGIYSDIKNVKAWPWYILQTGFRATEIFAAVLVFTVSAKRNRMKNKVHDGVIEMKDKSSTFHTENASFSTINIYPSTTTDDQRTSSLPGMHRSNGTAATINEEITSAEKNGLLFAQGRRMSMFSGLHQSKVSAGVKNDEIPSSGGRRTSIFSGLHQLKVSAGAKNNTLASDTCEKKVNIFSRSRQSKVSAVTNNDEIPSANGRRMNIFSALHRCKVSAVAKTDELPSVQERKTSTFSGKGENGKMLASHEGKVNANQCHALVSESQRITILSKFNQASPDVDENLAPDVDENLAPDKPTGRSIFPGLHRAELPTDNIETKGHTESAHERRFKMFLGLRHKENTPVDDKKRIFAARRSPKRRNLFVGLREGVTQLIGMGTVKDELEDTREQGERVETKETSLHTHVQFLDEIAEESNSDWCQNGEKEQIVTSFVRHSSELPGNNNEGFTEV